MAGIFWAGFEKTKLRSHLMMSLERLKLQGNKRRNEMQLEKREIAGLLRDRQFDRSRIKVESIIRKDREREACDIVETMCNLLSERVTLIATEKACPTDMLESAHTVMWASKRLQADELNEVRNQLGLRYGDSFIGAAMKGEGAGCHVNPAVRALLTVSIPADDVKVRYLTEIAAAHNVAFDPRDLSSKGSLLPSIDTLGPPPPTTLPDCCAGEGGAGGGAGGGAAAGSSCCSGGGCSGSGGAAGGAAAAGGGGGTTATIISPDGSKTVFVLPSGGGGMLLDPFAAAAASAGGGGAAGGAGLPYGGMGGGMGGGGMGMGGGPGGAAGNPYGMMMPPGGYFPGAPVGGAAMPGLPPLPPMGGMGMGGTPMGVDGYPPAGFSPAPTGGSPAAGSGGAPSYTSFTVPTGGTTMLVLPSAVAPAPHRLGSAPSPSAGAPSDAGAAAHHMAAQASMQRASMPPVHTTGGGGGGGSGHVHGGAAGGEGELPHKGGEDAGGAAAAGEGAPTMESLAARFAALRAARGGE